MDEHNPELIVDADGLVPQVNPADFPVAPPEGVDDVDAAAIDEAANRIYTSTLAAMGDDASADEALCQCLKGIMVSVVRRVRPEVEGSPEWTKDYHQKTVAAAERFRLALIEELLQSALLLEHLRRLRGPGLSLN